MAALAGVSGRLLSRFQRALCLIERRQDLLRQLHTSYAVRDAVLLKMPALSPTMEEGTIVKWYKKEGDAIAAGDVLCDIQTDKAVVSFEVEDDGILAKIIKGDDTKDIKIGTLIGVMVEEGDDWKNIEIPQESKSTSAGKPEATENILVNAKKDGQNVQQSYGPAVRTLLEQYAVKLESIAATGPNNRVLKGDVLKYIKEKSLKPVEIKTPLPQPAAVPVTKSDVHLPSPPSATKASAVPLDSEGFVDLPLTGMRKTIAKRLTESKQNIPHAYSSIECNMQQITDLRKKLLAENIKVSVNDFIIKAAAVSLQTVPGVNAQWNGGDAQLLSNIDISVAVATDTGLITPIVQDAIGKGVKEISDSVKELAGRARQGKLKLNEFQGGSFTISNLGMFGIREFTAVINPPQACILAIGAARVVPDAEGAAKTMVTVTMSSDARVVDDALAAQFLKVFKDTMEDPTRMLCQPKTPSMYDAEDEALSKLFAK